MKRVFLGWNRPALDSAADYLIEEHRRGPSIDLGDEIIVLPVSRAGRRLLEILLERSEAGGDLFVPPRMVTVGGLPEFLYEPIRPVASSIEQTLAWFHALRESDPLELEPILPDPPERDDFLGWLSLADVIAGLQRELAGGGLRIEEVARRAQALDELREPERWEKLAAVEVRYFSVLERHGVEDPYEARRRAVDEGRCRSAAGIVLVAVAEVSGALRRMLGALSTQVTSLIFAPPSEESSFDELGALRPEAWRERKLPLDLDRVDLADQPVDQAVSAARVISSYGGRYSAEEIAIGVPDAEVPPHLEQVLGRCGLPLRNAAGIPLERGAPFRLLDEARRFREERSFRSLAALLRHPDLESFLRNDDPGPASRGLEARGEEEDWLTAVDRYAASHLPDRLGGEWPDGGGRQRIVKRLHDRVESWLAPLDGPPRELSQWIPPILEVILSVYGEVEFDRGRIDERQRLEMFEVLGEGLRELHDVGEAWWPKVDATVALRWILSLLRRRSVPPPGGVPAIELLGWLELLLDDAPALIVTGLNEGFVPQAVNSDPFLPDQLRSRLGLVDNERRLARDAYVVSGLLHSREKLNLVLGRRTTESDPLTPSRLLFLCEDGEILERVKELFPEEEATASTDVFAPGILRGGGSGEGFRIPRPDEGVEPLRSMRVTAFRDYLACPYRFYLRHVLGLEEVTDAREEMDGRAFGSLAHEVLQAFGEGPVADSAREDEISDFLDLRLAERGEALFGSDPRPVIRVQMAHLRERLRAFASWQAARRAGGWRIEHTEVSVNDAAGAVLDVDGEPMGLRGRIDRIDLHESTGEWVVLDYKTSESVKKPETIHRKRKSGWVDLQLPLYRHLARPLGLRGEVKLGYVSLPKDTSRVGAQLAGWSASDLDSADDAAREVVRRIRAGEFWPPATRPPPFSEEFSRICQDGQFGGRSQLIEEES